MLYPCPFLHIAHGYNTAPGNTTYTSLPMLQMIVYNCNGRSWKWMSYHDIWCWTYNIIVDWFLFNWVLLIHLVDGNISEIRRLFISLMCNLWTYIKLSLTSTVFIIQQSDSSTKHLNFGYLLWKAILQHNKSYSTWYLIKWCSSDPIVFIAKVLWFRFKTGDDNTQYTLRHE